MAAAEYHFLSFVRSGFAASITAPDTFGAAQPAIATAPVGVAVSGAAAPVTHAAAVRGPGDVIGLATGEIVRSDPIDGAVGVEPNYFAQVEFDRPDVPWLFTPAASVGERLRPWIVLVVVDLDGPNPCALMPGTPLPQLQVPSEASGQLPDLSASYLWAHAQVVTPDGQTVAAALSGDPRLSVARLMCPRHLEPFRWYLAAVVPAFEVGRLAGLGLSVTPGNESRLEPAWAPGGAVVLPVLYSFRFKTGDRADFETLARQIVGRRLPPEVGSRPLDVSRPGAGLPAFPAPADIGDTRAIEWLDGALAPLDAGAHPARDEAAASAFRASLTVLLDRPAALLRGGDPDPVIAPPIYGDQHAHVVELEAGQPPPWIGELNLDPKARVAAGLGTQVVQQRQEDLVARAWQQLGDVLEANRLLRAAQLARSGSLRVHARLAALAPASLLAVSAPAHGRIMTASGTAVTVAKAVRDSRLPTVVAETAFRRLTRPSATMARTAAMAALAETIAGRFAVEEFIAPVDGPDGVNAMREATEVIGLDQVSAVLAALGDTQAADPARLDTMLATLGANASALPTGDEIRAGTMRTDVGAVTFVSGLGAVKASAIAAVLAAATAPRPLPPPPFPPIRPPIPPIRPFPPPFTRRAALPDIVFRPGGRDKVLDGDVLVRGGTVVIANTKIRQIVDGAVLVHPVDDARWEDLTQRAEIPRPAAAADPVTDPGSRLNAIRNDPATIGMLARLADGRLDSLVTLDGAAAKLATDGAASTSLQQLAAGSFSVALPVAEHTNAGGNDLDAARSAVIGAAAAFDRFATVADAPPPTPGPVLDLVAAHSTLLTRFDPETTVAARFALRIDKRTTTGVTPRDDLDPVMGCPQFLDPMWQALRDLGNEWLLPGLEFVLPDTAALVRTNPGFVAAHMVALNHELMRELLWREYPTDRRGTGFTRFWGRAGADDIGPVHRFTGALADNLLAGRDGEAVLLVRGELLRRYPGSIVYLSRATQQDSELALDDATIILPAFRGDLPPDVTFVGFPITADELRTPGDPWWFVIAQPPSEPRFGLDEPSADTPAVPSSANDLAWSHLSPDGQPQSPTPFAIADPPLLHGLQLDGSLTWGESAAVQARLTYQRPVRVAIRAADLLPPLGPDP